MAKFGLACEGITDQIVIENILCGFYKDYEDLDEEIQAFEPLRDETGKKQEKNSGGWTKLLTYLAETRFRDDVLNSEYTIIQIDTDISEENYFSISQNFSDIDTFVENIKQKLISSIDKNVTFYESNQSKIIFAISVHSLECWLLPIYEALEDDGNEVIENCFESLKKANKSIKVKKNYQTYNNLSQALLENKELLKISSKNSSFKIFLDALPKTI